MARSVSLPARHVVVARPRPVSLWRHLFDALALHRQRARLAALDDHLLDDIGLSRGDALAEAARPNWDVPTHWRA